MEITSFRFFNFFLFPLYSKNIVVDYNMTDKIRPSPTESATIYKTGTKRKGNDGNTWIVVENINGVKRWKIFKKITSSSTKSHTKESKKSISITQFYDVPQIKRNNYKKWFENLTKTKRNTIDKLINVVVPLLKENGMNVLIVPLPISTSGIYWIDYVWDFAKEKSDFDILDKTKSTIMFIIKLDSTMHIADDYVAAQHVICRKDIKLVDDILTKNFKNKYEWNKRNTKEIFINL